MTASRFLLWAALAAGGAAQAGPVFDDYLNHVRPGPGTAPGDTAATASSGRPVGQTFSVAPGTGEIYRIGVRPVYETWGPGESVTLTLYDAARGGSRIGRYAIDHATCRVQPIHETQDRVLWFHLRARVKARGELRFELSVEGGDGQVAFQAFGKDAYADGQAIGAPGGIRDLAFMCDVKPVADRQANLRAFFNERLDIGRPELAAVKQAVEAGDFDRAVAETVRHFHAKMDVWGAWKDQMEVRLDPNADNSLADLLLENRLRHKETGQPVPWRPESYWIAEYPTERTPPKHAVDPSLYTWHPGRSLGGAYTATGRAEYARKAVDLMMQFILDNPNPKRSGLPWYFELWNDRTAAARAPGHGTLVYARLYHFDGFTDDERMVFFAFLEDNAFWDYQATSGANWGAEAAKACYEFGLAFPEWKLSPRYVAWGTARLAEIVLRDVRGDGTSIEAAIKYHAMVARRLRGMIEDHREGRIRLDEALLGRLTRTVEGMYDHMAHTLQPHGYVVMCGDSWYEDYRDELAAAGRLLDRPDFVWVGTGGREGRPPVPVSRVFPEGGYFIMRSDFGGPGLDYAAARQLFLHNGMWFGSHGHNDLTSINLYAFGRPLVIDPGQYDHEPPPGIDRYWQSSIHSMLVADGGDTRREPGPGEWVSNPVIDWYDGRHNGYRKEGQIGSVRRRVAFLKPDLFLVDDSAESPAVRDWAQVWNLTDPAAEYDAASGTIRTTFPGGGNILIVNQDPSRLQVSTAEGITAAGEQLPRTRIFRLSHRTADPRFRTLLVPYNGPQAPAFDWKAEPPADRKADPDDWSTTVQTAAGTFACAFGRTGRPVRYRLGPDEADADFAVIRTDARGEITGWAWAAGRLLSHKGQVLARADQRVHNLGVVRNGATLEVTAPEPELTLAVAARDATAFVLNGRPVADPTVREGMFYPFADAPAALVADDRDAFERRTRTEEWTRVPDPASWATGYTHHETDPGRGESGDFMFDLPRAGRWRVEVHLPAITMEPSDRVDYVIPGKGRPVEPGGAVVAARGGEGTTVVTVNQQARSGWTTLGEFNMKRGRLRIQARNRTETDGLYFIADAMRAIPVDEPAR